jgi:hypothetical protein
MILDDPTTPTVQDGGGSLIVSNHFKIVLTIEGFMIGGDNLNGLDNPRWFDIIRA